MNYRRILLAASLTTLLAAANAQAQTPAGIPSGAPGGPPSGPSGSPPGRGNTPPPPITALAMMSASIPSSNLQRSIDFYTKALGLNALARVEMGKVIEVPMYFPGSGAYLLLQYSTDKKAKLPIRGALNRVALMVPDLKALEAKLATAGYSLSEPIKELAEYRVAIAFIQDPDGNQFELVQRLPAP